MAGPPTLFINFQSHFRDLTDPSRLGFIELCSELLLSGYNSLVLSSQVSTSLLEVSPQTLHICRVTFVDVLL